MVIPWLADALSNAEWTSLTVRSLNAALVLYLVAVLCGVFCGFLLVLFSLKPFKRRKFPRIGAGGGRGEAANDDSDVSSYDGVERWTMFPRGEGGKRVLLVTAHPDDECMFFGPTIVELIDAGASVHVLCFSAGGYGSNCTKTRKQELLKSCSILRIPPEHVTLLNFSNLPDDPKANWSTNIIAALVLRYIETYQCDAVITFDRGGVSNHPNHKALFSGVQLLIYTRLLPPYCKFLSLKTVRTSLKYLPLLEVPVAYLTAHVACLASLRQRYRIQKAMQAHASQMVWFRKLYILFSRYLYLNTYENMTESYKPVIIPRPATRSYCDAPGGRPVKPASPSPSTSAICSPSRKNDSETASSSKSTSIPSSPSKSSKSSSKRSSKSKNGCVTERQTKKSSSSVRQRTAHVSSQDGPVE